MTSARTTPPFATISRKALNGASAQTADTSTISRPKRRSGLSEPYFAIASAYGSRRNGVAHADADLLEDLDDERLDQAEDEIDVRERDLDVHLREFGLAVGAQVLVAKALHDLEVRDPSPRSSGSA